MWRWVGLAVNRFVSPSQQESQAAAAVSEERWEKSDEKNKEPAGLLAAAAAGPPAAPPPPHRSAHQDSLHTKLSAYSGPLITNVAHIRLNHIMRRVLCCSPGSAATRWRDPAGG